MEKSFANEILSMNEVIKDLKNALIDQEKINSKQKDFNKRLRSLLMNLNYSIANAKEEIIKTEGLIEIMRKENYDISKILTDTLIELESENSSERETIDMSIFRLRELEHFLRKYDKQKT